MTKTDAEIYDDAMRHRDRSVFRSGVGRLTLRWPRCLTVRSRSRRLAHRRCHDHMDRPHRSALHLPGLRQGLAGRASDVRESAEAGVSGVRTTLLECVEMNGASDPHHPQAKQ